MVRLMLVLGLVLSLAACGGSSRTDGLSKAEEAALEARLAEAEAATLKAEAAIAQAELDKAKLEADKARAEAEVQHQLRAAEAARLAAEAARLEAETARQEAEDARGEAETARGGEAEAEQREKERLAAEAEEARLQALREEASVAFAGLPITVSAGLTLPPDDVDPKYRAPALRSAPAVAPAPAVTFTNPQVSSAGRWNVTTAYNRGQAYEDTIVVYSDVEAPTPTPIDEEYTDANDQTDIFDIRIVNSDHGNLITSGQFPTNGSTKTFDLNYDTGDDNTDDAVRIAGTFRRASGHFLCTNPPCTIQHRGGTVYLTTAGTWTFQTPDTARVDVADADFMYFGWWRKKQDTTSQLSFSYGAFSNQGRAPVEVPASLTATATYQGPAIGQYAIDQPVGTQSNHGEFKATARLTANFGTSNAPGSVSGSVFGFNVAPDWSLTLMETPIADMPTTTSTNVSWEIDGNTRDGGTWTGNFHSATMPYGNQIPEGLTGRFTAQYGTVGRMIGAYGTRHSN